MYEYGWIILVAVIAIVYFVSIYKKYGKGAMLSELKKQAYMLMLAAEDKYGKGTGPIKFQWVVDEFYSMLPNTYKKIWTREQTGQFVQNLFDKMKEYLNKKSNRNIPPKVIEPTSTITEFR